METGIRCRDAYGAEVSVLDAKIKWSGDEPAQQINLKGYCVVGSDFGEKPGLRLVGLKDTSDFHFAEKPTGQLKRRFVSKSLNCGACRFAGLKVAVDDLPATLMVVSQDGKSSAVLAELSYTPVEALTDRLWLDHLAGRLNAVVLLQEFEALDEAVRLSEAGQLLHNVLGMAAQGYEGPHEGRMISWPIENGRSPLFRQYMSMLRTVVRPARFSNHGLTRRFSHMSLTDDFWGALNRYLSELSVEFGPAFVVSGSLLGLVRENGLLPHDDDLDVAILIDVSDAAQAASRWMDIRRTLEARDALNTHVMVSVPKPILKPLRIKGVPIDLFPAWIENGNVYVYPHTYGEIPESSLLPLQHHPKFGVPIPAKPEEMLILNYGEDWRIPDTAASLPWGKWRKNFRDFLSTKAFDAW